MINDFLVIIKSAMDNYAGSKNILFFYFLYKNLRYYFESGIFLSIYHYRKCIRRNLFINE